MSSKKNSKKFYPRKKKKSSDEKDDDSHVPLLTHGEKSNLLLWQKRMEIVASVKYGKLARNVLKKNDYCLPDIPDVENYDQTVGGAGLL